MADNDSRDERPQKTTATEDVQMCGNETPNQIIERLKETNERLRDEKGVICSIAGHWLAGCIRATDSESSIDDTVQALTKYGVRKLEQLCGEDMDIIRGFSDDLVAATNAEVHEHLTATRTGVEDGVANTIESHQGGNKSNDM